jgi:tryptophan synthase alpha chain
VNSRIDQVFIAAAQTHRKLLIPFITAGDPHPDWSVDIMHALVAEGADVLELGVPFSDPMADGPVIQAASERAIEHGTSLTRVLDMVRIFRQRDQHTPVILMGYMNPLERYGPQKFPPDATAAGVDGLLLVDCPPDEMGVLGNAMDTAGLVSICLVAPTTTDTRLARIARSAAGFVYYVSFKGVTGAGRLDSDSLAQPVARIRAATQLPVAVGFGIKDAESAAAVAEHADAVVIGSALVEALATARTCAVAVDECRAFLAPVRQALDNRTPNPNRADPRVDSV